MCGFSESAVIMVVVAAGLGETLHRSPRNAESIRIERRAFRPVPPDGGLLVSYPLAKAPSSLVCANTVNIDRSLALYLVRFRVC